MTGASLAESSLPERSVPENPTWIAAGTATRSMRCVAAPFVQDLSRAHLSDLPGTPTCHAKGRERVVFEKCAQLLIDEGCHTRAKTKLYFVFLVVD
jgi:hypothetical protein